MSEPTPYDDPLKVSRREVRELRRQLRELTTTTTAFLAHLDRAMEGPSTPERGRRIGEIRDALAMANDSAKHFGLGLAFDEPAFKDPRLPKRRPRGKGRGGRNDG